MRVSILLLGSLVGCASDRTVEALDTIDAIAKDIPAVPVVPPRCVETVPNSACDLTPEDRLGTQNAIRSELEWCRGNTIESVVGADRRSDLVREVARDAERTRRFVELSAADHLGLATPAQRAEFADVLHAYEAQVAADVKRLMQGPVKKQLPLVPELDRLTDEQLARLRARIQNDVTQAWRKLRPLRFLDGESIDDADMAGSSP